MNLLHFQVLSFVLNRLLKTLLLVVDQVGYIFFTFDELLLVIFIKAFNNVGKAMRDEQRGTIS